MVKCWGAELPLSNTVPTSSTQRYAVSGIDRDLLKERNFFQTLLTGSTADLSLHVMSLRFKSNVVYTGRSILFDPQLQNFRIFVFTGPDICAPHSRLK